MPFNNKKVFGLIPARAGSKGVLGKNTYPINSKLLIDFTIDAALGCSNIDHVYVSSDSIDILKHSEKRTSVIERPEKISNDNSSAIDVVNHFYNFLVSNKLVSIEDFYVIYLQPTSPLRSKEIIDKSFEFMTKSNKSSLISLVENDYTPFKSFSVDEYGLAQSLFDESLTNECRQNLLPTYRANGAIYTFLISQFIKNKGFPSNDSLAFIMDKETSLDIDTIKDIEDLKAILAETS